MEGFKPPPEKKRRNDEEALVGVTQRIDGAPSAISVMKSCNVSSEANSKRTVETPKKDVATTDLDLMKEAPAQTVDRKRVHESSSQPQTDKSEEAVKNYDNPNNGDECGDGVVEGINPREKKLDWDAISQYAETRESVQKYWNAKHRRDQAQDRFDTVLNEIHLAYSKCIDSVLEAAGQVHQEQRQDILDAMEAELVQLFAGNDRMRSQMQRDLERSSQQWQVSIFNLMASLTGRSAAPGSDSKGDSKMGLSESLPGKTARSAGTIPASEEKEEGEGALEDELDWDGMMQRHPPAAESIRRFLASRERLEVVDDKFATALDEIHVALKANIGVLMETACRIHDDQTQALDSMEDQLLDHLDYNHQQRTWMQQTLEESAQKAQQYFTSLLTSLHQEGPKPISPVSVPQQPKHTNTPVGVGTDAQGKW